MSTKELPSEFVKYLVCSPRPIHALLNPNLLDVKTVYVNEFVDLMRREVPLEQLLEVRRILIDEIRASLTDDEKAFILSVKCGVPDFAHLPFVGIDQLPALKWKVLKIERIDQEKAQCQLVTLTAVLER